MAVRKETVSMWLALVIVMGFAASSNGQDKPIRKTALPRVVLKTADEQSKGATVRGYATDTEDGKLEYEVQMTVDGHGKDVSIDPSGNVLEVEEQVLVDKLPTEVREGLQKRAGHGRLIRVESIVKRGQLVAYEAQVLDGSRKSEVQVGPQGQTLNHEE
jgi:hypothetical protein